MASVIHVHPLKPRPTKEVLNDTDTHTLVEWTWKPKTGVVYTWHDDGSDPNRNAGIHKFCPFCKGRSRWCRARIRFMGGDQWGWRNRVKTESKTKVKAST